MSASSNKPDLDESINVAQAHGNVVSTATNREKTIADNGREPISVWTIAGCGLALLAAGAILANAGPLFNYAQLFRPGYIRDTPPGMADAGPKTKPALEAYMARGQKIYSAKCNGCHGADAKGDGANYPSLVGSAWATGETERFAMIVLNGIQGPTSTGKAFPGLMPPQGIGMAPEDLAGVLTYVRNNFGNSTGDVVTVEMAKAAMDISGKRTPGPVTAEELTASHVKALPGESIDPTAPVDPATLLPAAAEEGK